MDLNELYEKAITSILELEEDDAMELLEAAIEEGVELSTLLSKGYSAGMQQLGDLFSDGEVFLPELMIAAEIMQLVSDRIDQVLNVDGTGTSSKLGKILMATVEGDVHDIGKGICCSLLKSNDIEVFDIGRDISAATIVDKAEELGVDIIGMSALLTTTMVQQQTVIDLLVERGLRDKYKVMVGGAPVTGRWADKIEADAYTEDAAECVLKVKEFLTA